MSRQALVGKSVARLPGSEDEVTGPADETARAEAATPLGQVPADVPQVGETGPSSPVDTPDAEGVEGLLGRIKALEEMWRDRSQRLRLTTRDRFGNARQRTMDRFERRYHDDELRTLTRFQDPAELTGLTLLAYAYPDRPGLLWLYLPTLRRIRQLTSTMRDDRFVDSDLTYGDLDLLTRLPSSREGDASMPSVGEESVNGVDCYRIEIAPDQMIIAYGRIVAWLGRTDLVPRRIELYRGTPRRDEPPEKIIVQDDVRWLGSVPLAFRIEVETPAAGTRTTIVIEDATIDPGLNDDLFRVELLGRG